MSAATHLTRHGAPVRAIVDGKERIGEFGGKSNNTYGLVRIGHRVRTVLLSDIIEIQAPAGGER